MLNKKTYILLYILGSFFVVNGQSKLIQVVSFEDNIPIPFTIIQVDSSFYQTDIDGFATVAYSIKKKLKLSQPFFQSLDTILAHHQDSIQLYLYPQVITDINTTDASSRSIISNVLYYANENNIYNNKNFSYISYNKARVSTDNIKEVKGLLSKILAMFSIKMKDFEGNHHVLLAESVTKRKYVNKHNNKEFIISSKMSGIDNPKMLTLNSQLQSMSIYEKFIKVIDKSYVSPVYGGAKKRYNFKIIDKIKRLNDELYIIQFNPNGKLKQVLLTGILYVSSRNWAVESAIIRPDKASSLDFDVYFNYELENNMWVPSSYSTRIALDNVTAKKFQFTTRYSTYIYDFKFDASLSKTIWDDVSIEYVSEDSVNNLSIIEANRKEFFSLKDNSTYSFYDTVGSLNNIDIAFDFSEHLYEKEIKTKYLNIDLNRAFDFNNYEGARIGIGVNKDFGKKEKINIGGHMAYGLKDNDAKFGLGFRYKVLPLKKLTVFGSFDNETYESAQSIYSFYRYQYTTEWLRRFSIDIMDIAKRYLIGFETSPIKYTSFSFKLMSSNNFTPYSYYYKNNDTQIYQYTDLELGVRFAFGETNFKLYHNKYRLKTHYPILWTKLNFGLDNFLGGEYDYVKFDSRLEYTMRSF